MSWLAVVRPGEQNVPLFLHVLGAMVLLGSLVLAITSLAGSARDGTPVARLGLRALLWGALPAWIVMRVGAEWIASKEGYSDAPHTPSWLDIGYIVAEPNLLLLLIAALLTGLSLRRARRQGGDGGGLVRAAGVLVAILLIADLVAIFAMTTKPS